MKTWQVRHYGEPEEMVLAEAETLPPGPGEVLIRNRAAGVNFFDILQIQGKYQAKPEFPFTIGGEVAGVVEAVGEGVDTLAAGDRVLAFTGGGGYAECSLAKASATFPFPAEMSFEEAATFAIVYQTSYFALYNRAKLLPGERLLVHAGASGVGVAAIQLGKAIGSEVIATAGGDEKIEFCKEQGADHGLSYRDPTWVDRIKELTGGRGVDVIYDPVGGDVFDLSTKCIAPGGRLLVIGFAAGRIPQITANRILLKNMAVVGVFWGRHSEENPGYQAETQEALFELRKQGKIKPPAPKTYPLTEAPPMLRDLANRRILGKAALVMG